LVVDPSSTERKCSINPRRTEFENTQLVLAHLVHFPIGEARHRKRRPSQQRELECI
jgi:hypothetical protein